jgi:hypothetical protein
MKECRLSGRHSSHFHPAYRTSISTNLYTSGGQFLVRELLGTTPVQAAYREHGGTRSSARITR